jgi:Holliday junction resolvasome RuvABC DNA-binding subunit
VKTDITYDFVSKSPGVKYTQEFFQDMCPTTRGTNALKATAAIRKLGYNFTKAKELVGRAIYFTDLDENSTVSELTKEALRQENE